MKPVLYRYKDTESVIKVMDGYTPGEGWEPLYSQDQISSAVNAALKATAPDERVKELEAELAATEIAIAEYRQQCLDNAAEIARLRSESEERLQNCAALVAEVERLRAAPATTPEQPRPFIPWSKEAEMLESWAAHLSHHKETP
jgi:DNA repair exonuclease SbcCD ATPase subunit